MKFEKVYFNEEFFINEKMIFLREEEYIMEFRFYLVVLMLTRSTKGYLGYYENDKLYACTFEELCELANMPKEDVKQSIELLRLIGLMWVDKDCENKPIYRVIAVKGVFSEEEAERANNQLYETEIV